MSNSIVLSNNLKLFNCNNYSTNSCGLLCPLVSEKRSKVWCSLRVLENCKGGRGGRNWRVLEVVVPKAAKRGSNRKRKSWWERFFFEEDGNWLGFREEDLEDEDEDEEGGEEGRGEEERFEEWKKRAEAIIELREAQEGVKNEEERRWEDWLVSGEGEEKGRGREWSDDEVRELREEDMVGGSRSEGVVERVRNLVLGREDDDDDELLYEDRVFRYASLNSAKFLAILIIIPWAMDFLVHDYVLMPFLDRYVKTVPLAAEMLDVRRSQKLEMVKEIKTEKSRLNFEIEIGKSPPLSDDEMWWELRHKALELREEWRLTNRNAFASIFSDMAFGITLFLLLYFNQSKVALLKFTGYKIVNNITDTGKAFLIILITDIFLGYHSESGWQTVCEIIVEHYGLEVDQSTITLFICLVPVFMDACVKLWIFKYLPRLSPKVSNIFQEMRRH